MSNYYYKPIETNWGSQNIQAPQQPQPSFGNAIMPLASGALQLGGDIYAANQATNSIQTQSPGLQQIDELGTPVYNLGGQASYIKGLNENNYGRGLGVRGMAAGATAGAAFGPIGAGIGAVVGLAAGLFGKRRAKKKAREKIRVAKGNFRTAQQDFNEANIGATQNRLAREQYNDMLSDPYGINTSYYG